MVTYWLSMHAGYGCQHSGACCRSRWPIPLEVSRVSAVEGAIRSGHIAVGDSWLLPTVDAPAEAAGVIAISDEGHCVFHQHHRCTIHEALGHGALPSACQHFPRVCLLDPRGVFVTLSHFCPTAATLLFDEGPVSIVEGPPALPGEVEPEGLDAREVWPPLLTERVLMDHEGYGSWERHVVSVLAGEDRASSPELALARLHADAQTAIDSGTHLSGGAVFDVARARTAPPRPLIAEEARPRFDLVRSAVPMPLTWPHAPSNFEREWSTRAQPAWSSWAPVVQRFLAAHAFGSWLAYQGRGLRTIVSGLEAALAVLQVEVVRACQARNAVLDRATLYDAIRQSDLLLRHYVDRQAFADAMRAGAR